MNKRRRTMLTCLAAASLWGLASAQGIYGPVPTVDYNYPNYSYSSNLAKFVDRVPGLGPTAANGLGQFLPVATPVPASTVNQLASPAPSWATSDQYYEIALVDYREQMHSGLPKVTDANNLPTTRKTGILKGGTRLRGYVQIEPPGLPQPAGSAHIPLYYSDGTRIKAWVTNAARVGVQSDVFAYTEPHYLGPLILATRNVAVRIKFYNLLPAGSAGDLYLPTDTTVLGAGDGPRLDALNNPIPYSKNRATIHLHGGLPSWISDGTAHQWIAPFGETSYPQGASMVNVPDMPVPAGGSMTFHFPNQHSGRLLFYHDHAWGMTAVDVFAGEAAGYLVSDPAEEDALSALGVPGTVGSGTPTTDLAHLVPLVIQDKSWVWGVNNNTVQANGTVTVGPASTGTWALDPMWAKHVPGSQPGDLWYPHIYVPVQDPTSPDGLNPFGRWHYGPWFWPIFAATKPLPELSHTPESFMDTMTVNGTALPYLEVKPQKYRFRILNACNDRFLNMQIYQASAGIVTNINLITGGSGYVAPMVTFTRAPGDTGTGKGASATAIIDEATGTITSIVLDVVGSGYLLPPIITIEDVIGTGTGATATANIYSLPTEVGMIPFNPPQTLWPAGWGDPDGRIEGAPDPRYRGPAWMMIGTEGGILPNPTVIKNKPIDYDYNRGSVTVLNVELHSLYLGPAERADVVLDFSKFRGKTLILYNDCPAPTPAGVAYYDYPTCSVDNRDMGGAPPSPAGYGPHTRTIMQIRVSNDTGTGIDSTATPDYYDTTLFNALAATTGLPQIFRLGQDAPVVPEALFNPAYQATFGARPNTYSSISNNSLIFTPYGSSVAVEQFFKPKAIAEEMDFEYARMNANLGVELPFTGSWNQTTLWYGFVDPPTEIFNDGETQIWKLTHNGVDTHAIHFHLVNVQIINRVGWDNWVKPPDPEESGWKDTIKMNPLEDIIFAMKAKMATVPFGVPHSRRTLNPAFPTNSLLGFMNTDPLTGNPITVANEVTDFGQEYVWHCHLLGHEEYDMMRPVVVNVAETVPNAPSGLAANYLPNPSRVDLTWVDNSPNEISFIVERSLTSAFTTIQATFNVPANTPAFTDTTVVSGTYYYRVKAYNSQGQSPPSNVVQVTIVGAGPAAPTSLSATASTLSTTPPTVTLRWTDNATTETGFTIQRDTTQGFLNPTILTRAAFTGTGQITFVDSTVAQNATYYYRVRAEGSGGTFSPWSNIAGPVNTPGQLPVAPTNLRVTAGTTRTSIPLAWNYTTGIELGFHIWMSSTQNGTYSQVLTVPKGARTATVNGLARNTSYYFRVTAYNLSGDSASSPATGGVQGQTRN